MMMLSVTAGLVSIKNVLQPHAATESKIRTSRTLTAEGHAVSVIMIKNANQMVIAKAATAVLAHAKTLINVMMDCSPHLNQTQIVEEHARQNAQKEKAAQ